MVLSMESWHIYFRGGKFVACTYFGNRRLSKHWYIIGSVCFLRFRTISLLDVFGSKISGNQE